MLTEADIFAAAARFKAETVLENERLEEEVERLRGEAEAMRRDLGMLRGHHHEGCMAEIERLRAGLQLIANDKHRLMNEVARQTAASILGGKPIGEVAEWPKRDVSHAQSVEEQRFLHGAAAVTGPDTLLQEIAMRALASGPTITLTLDEVRALYKFLPGAAADAVEVERLQRLMQKIMARCADLLDEDQFNELDAMVGGICDAWVIAPAQKTLTDLARETNYQPSRYEAHLEARLADAEALLRDARSSIPGNAKFTLRRIDDFLRAGVTTVTVGVQRDADR